MEARQPLAALPPIPAKRYFTIGEVSELCAVKPHVLRYWEQEFSQLRPMKRRGNRRYYQHHEVLLVRKIRELLYDQGFTISGARNQLMDGRLNGVSHAGAPTIMGATLSGHLDASAAGYFLGGAETAAGIGASGTAALRAASADQVSAVPPQDGAVTLSGLRDDLYAVLTLLKPPPSRL